jgi:trimeric autotransporter adhesin
MAKDIIITPLDGDIVFDNSSGTECGSITQDGDNLVISNAVGDVLLGDGASDIYIGDGTNNVDILFEQSGAIKAEDGSTGVTLTIGSGDTTLVLESPISGNITASGNISASGTGSFGMVGIGTTTPSEKLEVSGTIKSISTSAAHLILNGDTNNTGDTGDVDAIIDFLADGNPGIYGYRINTENWAGQTALNFQEYINGAYTSRLFISKDGNVGIGTTTPTARLHVAGNILATTNITASSNIRASGFLTAQNITASSNISASGTITANAFVGSGASLTSLPSQTDNNFTTTLKNKLDAIEALADVTDATNVTAAGALMDSEVTNLADVKAFDTTDYATSAQGTTADAALPKSGGAMTGAITTNSTFDGRDVATDGTKLDTIETNADVTDATNVTAAGALMDSEVTNLAQVKAFDSSDYATAAQGSTADAAMPKSGGAFTGAVTTNSTIDGVDIATRDGVLTSTTTTANAALPKTGGAMTGAITTNSTFDGRDVATDGTKLDTIETNADVTDATNVTAAGALMDSELSGIAHVKSLNQSLTTTATPTFGTLTITNGTTFGEGSSDQHNFIGHITASGNISASGTITANSFVGALTGNAATATKIDSITNSDIVQLASFQTLRI